MAVLKEHLLTAIQQLPVYHVNATGTEVSVRCPYCGDSTKNSSHTHLYISLNTDKVFLYYCHKCLASGIVDRRFLNDINIYDPGLSLELSESIAEYRKSSKYIKNNSINIVRPKKKLILPPYNGSNSSYNKLYYVCERYNMKFDPDELTDKYKAIFSFKDFLEANEISKLNCSDGMAKALASSYIGFLSYDNSTIICRNINPNCDKRFRYYNYNIYNLPDAKKFYTVRTKVNKLNPTVKIVMAEGVFDIIGIKELYYENDNEDIIFTAVSGKGYNFVLNSLARLGFLTADIRIYSDKDVDISKYREMKKYSNMFKYNSATVYYNSLEKDYGVPFEKINVRSYKL